MATNEQLDFPGLNLKWWSRAGITTAVYKNLTFATLPTPAQAGEFAYITDSNTTVVGANAAGGGTNKVIVFYNGSNWIVYGPALNVPQITVFNTAGSGTYTPPSGALWLRVRVVGAGGGGGGSGTSAGAGTAGGASSFGALTANGGNNGGTTAGSGGTASGGNIANVRGGTPANALPPNSVGPTQFPIGGGCVLAPATQAATLPNGAGGAGGGNSTTIASGGAGGGGGYVEHVYTTIAASYAYTVGAKGTKGAAGTGGSAGGDGADGLIIVEAHFQ